MEAKRERGDKESQKEVAGEIERRLRERAVCTGRVQSRSACYWTEPSQNKLKLTHFRTKPGRASSNFGNE